MVARFASGFVLAALALSGLACDGFVDVEYLGEPRGTIAGVIVNERTDAVPAIDVAIRWYSLPPDPYDPAEPILLDSPVPVAPQFPSGFELLLHAPPREAVSSFPIDPAWEAEGFVALIIRGTAGQDIDERTLAMDERYRLLYLHEDLAPDSAQAKLHCGPLGAGYHLMEHACEAANGCTEPPTYPPESDDACGNWEAADGLDTVITLHLREARAAPPRCPREDRAAKPLALGR